MQPEKPFMFIGSSQEAREQKIVDALVNALKDDAHCVPWYHVPEFSTEGSATTFRALCEAANEYDFALFLFTPDDKIISRKTESLGPRDNVVLELGLFISAIGPDRVLAMAQKTSGSTKIPSDLAGVYLPRFYYDEKDKQKSLASIHAETRGFAQKIQTDGFRKIDLTLAHEWRFNSSERQLEVELSAARLTRARATIGRWKICIAARTSDPFVNIEDDKRVVFTPLRSLPATINDNFPFRIAETEFKGPIKAGDKIEVRVLLVPEALDFDPTTTLGDALRCRCREVEGFTYTTAKPTAQ